MGNYQREARHHADRIKYYYDHAGSAGSSQAEYHYSMLSDLIGRASRSKNDKSDVVAIQILKDECAQMMEEMKQREEQ